MACAILCCHLWPVWVHHIFPTLSHKRHNFRRKFVRYVFIYNLSETFLILRIIQWDIINVQRSSCKMPHYFCHILMKLEFSRHVLEKYSNIKFYGNPSSGSRVVPCGRTDMPKLIVAFRNFANAPKNGRLRQTGYLRHSEKWEMHSKFWSETRDYLGYVIVDGMIILKRS
jgi:hypothetical protein